MASKRKRPEQAIQRAVFEHIRRRGRPNVFAFHPANGGYRPGIEASILKGLGVVAGTPDVIIIHEGKCFAMELKAPNGKMAETQIDVISQLQRAGAITAVCVGLNIALKTLEGWGILRGEAYSAREDFGASINVAYEAIKARKAAGGKGWP